MTRGTRSLEVWFQRCYSAISCLSDSRVSNPSGMRIIGDEKNAKCRILRAGPDGFKKRNKKRNSKNKEHVSFISQVLKSRSRDRRKKNYLYFSKNYLEVTWFGKNLEQTVEKTKINSKVAVSVVSVFHWPTRTGHYTNAERISKD